MMKLLFLVFLACQILGGGWQEPQMRVNTQEELNLALIMERIEKTSPEGLEVIEKVKRKIPVIQKNQSAKTLGDAVEDCINGQGDCIIYAIGWEAVKSDSAIWSINYYFQDEERRYQKATWEYNEERNVLIPKEFTNATKFWVRRTKNLRP